jgi:hypothetical protein
MIEQKTKSPEELAQEIAEKTRVKEAKEKLAIAIRTAVNSAVTDPNVAFVLRYVMQLSGYQANPVALASTGDIAVNATLYNNGRESLYHDLRRSMSNETKNLIERSE